MKKYELKYTKGDDGVFCMSTVENPATKTQLVMFDDELTAMEFQDDEKRIIYSVAMRPNMLIPRKDINGEPAMVFYTEETVSDLQQNFFKNNSHNGATVNHDKKVRKDMYAFESWIVEDPEKDKATALGLQVQKGDWVLAQKVDNEEVWQKIKNKELTGFSIEAYLEPVLTKNEIEMTQEEIDARIKAVIQMTAEEDEAKKKAEEEAAAAEAEKMKMEGEGTPPAMTAEEMQTKIDELTTENVALEAQIAEMEAKSIEMSAEVAAAKQVAVEMGAELAKGIKPDGNAPKKKYEEMSAYERMQYNKQKRK